MKRLCFIPPWTCDPAAPPPAGIRADSLVLGDLHAALLPGAAHCVELPPDGVWAPQPRPGEWLTFTTAPSLQLLLASQKDGKGILNILKFLLKLNDTLQEKN